MRAPRHRAVVTSGSQSASSPLFRESRQMYTNVCLLQRFVEQGTGQPLQCSLRRCSTALRHLFCFRPSARSLVKIRLWLIIVVWIPSNKRKRRSPASGGPMHSLEAISLRRGSHAARHGVPACTVTPAADRNQLPMHIDGFGNPDRNAGRDTPVRTPLTRIPAPSPPPPPSATRS